MTFHGYTVSMWRQKCVLSLDRDLHNGPLCAPVILQGNSCACLCARVRLSGAFGSNVKPEIMRRHKEEARTQRPTCSPIDKDNQ